jgi:hypothetical protein
MLLQITATGTIWDIFMFFWLFLDAIFSYITGSAENLFTGLPTEAIPFVIGIICYSLLAFITWYIQKVGAGRKRLGAKIFYALVYIIAILFTIWRLGIVTIAQENIDPVASAVEFIISIIYILFAFILVIAFLKKITWLKRALIFLLWMLLLITTFISPIFSDFALNSNTVPQLLVIGFLFGLPNIAIAYQKAKKST